MGEVLVLGYGNTLRRDDGVGPLVAEAVSRWGREGLHALALHQLLPELAERLSGAELAIFVDAAVGLEETQRQPLAPGTRAPSLEHTGAPSWLLALARALYGRCPPAWLISIPAADLSFGEGISSQARRGMAAALREIEQVVTAAQSPRVPAPPPPRSRDL